MYLSQQTLIYVLLNTYFLFCYLNLLLNVPKILILVILRLWQELSRWYLVTTVNNGVLPLSMAPLYDSE